MSCGRAGGEEEQAPFKVLWLVLARITIGGCEGCLPPCQPARSTRRRRSAILSWDSSACHGGNMTVGSVYHVSVTT